MATKQSHKGRGEKEEEERKGEKPQSLLREREPSPGMIEKKRTGQKPGRPLQNPVGK